MTINYNQLRDDVTALIKDLGVSTQASVAHSEGGTSKGYIIISETAVTTTDPQGGRVVGTQLIGFIENIKTRPCPGDVVTTNNVAYKVREVAHYNPTGKVNVAYKLTLDA